MKKFLIIGSICAVGYKELFYHIKSGEIYCGYKCNKPMSFKNPYEDKELIVSISWWQNLKEPEKPYVELTKEFNGDYQKYDNYDAININRAADIPKDYYGVMGVPITFIEKLNRNQFEIVGITQSWDKVQTYLNEKKLFLRLFIKRKK